MVVNVFLTYEIIVLINFQNERILVFFTGYIPIHKGYRCINPQNHGIYMLGHVVFDESVFPYQVQTHAHQHNHSLRLLSL